MFILSQILLLSVLSVLFYAQITFMVFRPIFSLLPILRNFSFFKMKKFNSRFKFWFIFVFTSPLASSFIRLAASHNPTLSTTFISSLSSPSPPPQSIKIVINFSLCFLFLFFFPPFSTGSLSLLLFLFSGNLFYGFFIKRSLILSNSHHYRNNLRLLLVTNFIFH